MRMLWLLGSLALATSTTTAAGLAQAPFDTQDSNGTLRDGSPAPQKLVVEAHTACVLDDAGVARSRPTQRLRAHGWRLPPSGLGPRASHSLCRHSAEASRRNPDAADRRPRILTGRAQLATGSDPDAA